MLKRLVYIFFVSVVVLICSQTVQAGEIIGRLSDPNDYGINDFVDITSAWVEKDGTSLTFVMELRGDVPDPQDLLEYNSAAAYLWLVDADNNPNTGQSPGDSGSEFNVRAVISQNPNLAGGFVDNVAELPGGGSGTVQVIGKQVRITIFLSQIASPDAFHWRSDAFYVEHENEPPVAANHLTESALARVSDYFVLYQYDNIYYHTDLSYSASQPGEPPMLVMENYGTNSSDTAPVYLSIDGKYPPEDPEDYQVLAQSLGSSGFMHIRNLARFDINNADPNIFGISQASSNFDIEFILYGPNETGPIPPNTFVLKYTHDYHLLGINAMGQTTAWSYAQFVINSVDPETHAPIEQMGVFTHERYSCNNDIFEKYQENIDLADYGFEYGVLYGMDMLLVGEAQTDSYSPQPSAQSICDTTLTASVETSPIAGDINDDTVVNLQDLAILAAHWLEGM